MVPDLSPPADAPAFLAASGWGDGEIVAMPGDASFRRYFRVWAPGRHAILMDAPPPHENPRPFLNVARWLCERGFAAPKIHAEDAGRGLVLLEDFGDARMRDTIDVAPEATIRLYERAIDTLIELRDHDAGPFGDYTLAEYQREANLLTDWYCPAIGLEVDVAGYEAAWAAALANVLAEPKRVTVLRDYHAENLMLLEDGSLGLLDFQDALAGHAAYDLVSLLQDARRDVEPELESAMLYRYCSITREADAFRDAYHVLGAQRNAKIVGIFTRLWQRDGKPRYPSLLPRVWGYLERDLAHPALGPVADWFDANIPADKRGDPIELTA